MSKVRFNASHCLQSGKIHVLGRCQIVSRCRTALTWCFRNATSFNADPGRLYLSGHSAGAHLAMMLLATHWRDWDDLPDVLVKGVCPISGLYDLEPIRLSYRNDVLKLNPTTAHRNSPLHKLPDHGIPLIAAVGAGESDEFRRQNCVLASAWRERRFPCRELTLSGAHHFDIVQGLLHADHPLTCAILSQMCLD